MPGISSRIGTFAIAKQSAQGSPATTPTTKFFMSGAPSLAPNKDVGRLSRTDAGRDIGPSYTSRLSVGGDVPVYAHPDGLALLFAACLGSNADSGTSPNYTHTITPSSDGLWVTCWRMVGNQIVEQFQDCKITSVRLAGTAGNPLEATLGIVGLKSIFLAADTGTTPLSSTPYLFMDALGTLKLDTVAQKINSVTFGIENNFSLFQADDYFATDIDPGGREVSLSVGMKFTGATAAPDYRTFFYGSTSGTTLSSVIVTPAFDFTWAKSANTSVQITLPQVTYAGVPVQPDPGGDPIMIDLACNVEAPSGGSIVTVVVKDQNTTIQ